MTLGINVDVNHIGQIRRDIREQGSSRPTRGTEGRRELDQGNSQTQLGVDFSGCNQPIWLWMGLLRGSHDTAPRPLIPKPVAGGSDQDEEKWSPCSHASILARLMPRILLLTSSQGASAEVLPSLGLLQHQVRVLPLEASILVDVPEVDVLFIDARKDLPAAKSLTRLLQTTGVDCPIISITTEGGLSAMNADWGIHDVILDTAGPAEVEARIRLAVGRMELDRALMDPSLREIRTGEIVIDENSYTAKVRGRTLDLTFKEFELLKFLAQHPGRVFTRAQLLQEIWGYDYFGGTRTVDVHIRRLRSKLGPEFEALIGTVRNVGYRFTLPNSGKENSLSELV